MFFKQEQQKSFAIDKLRSRAEDVGTSMFCVFWDQLVVE